MKIDHYILFAILLIGIDLFLVAYPILNFYMTYSSLPHGLSKGMKFKYNAILLTELIRRLKTGYVMMINGTYYDDTDIRITLVLYKLEGYVSIKFRPQQFNFTADKITVILNSTIKLSYENSSFIRLILPKYGENITVIDNVKYVTFSYEGFKRNGLYPDENLGYAKVYSALVINGSQIIAAPWKMREELNFHKPAVFSFLKMSRHMLAEFITSEEFRISLIIVRDLGRYFPILNHIYNEAKNYLGDGQEFLLLEYVNSFPEQAFKEAFIRNFNSLFPLSYALVAIAIILVILKVRKI
ncbi:MAG: hypothetical protein DRJ66_01215 [Thermoprotei archaeon]|nr:MAG: hypothetical protein DRJ66_01215 [Thermoprotei archaeon]